jgi:hypothetical protein
MRNGLAERRSRLSGAVDVGRSAGWCSVTARGPRCWCRAAVPYGDAVDKGHVGLVVGTRLWWPFACKSDKDLVN